MSVVGALEVCVCRAPGGAALSTSPGWGLPRKRRRHMVGPAGVEGIGQEPGDGGASVMLVVLAGAAGMAVIATRPEQ